MSRNCVLFRVCDCLRLPPAVQIGINRIRVRGTHLKYCIVASLIVSWHGTITTPQMDFGSEDLLAVNHTASSIGETGPTDGAVQELAHGRNRDERGKENFHSLSVYFRRERSKVPYIVRQCIEEVEKRGIEEVGIYRISGVATDIQTLKAVFDTNTKDILVMLSEMDINAIAGTLKLYFRELPEPLLTDRLYLAFMEGIALSDPAAKENCMMHLLRSLPEPNLITFLSLLEHLKRVAEKEPINKMSLHNLGTVFGPTLLRPSEVEQKAHINLASDIWSHDVMAQVQVLLYYLQHAPISIAELKRNTLYYSTDV
ncbi:UNVERIFIED_CONTAM: hypothetical protein FKN15_024320 [Acipenser sinensis]